MGVVLLRHHGGNPELFTSLFLFPEFLLILFIPSFCRVNASLRPQLLLSPPTPPTPVPRPFLFLYLFIILAAPGSSAPYAPCQREER